METTHAAALAITRQSIEMMRAALRGLPDEAMEWAPAAGMSTPTVLAAHTCSSLRFFMALGCGRVSSLAEYREGPRAESFRVRGWTPARAVAELDRLEQDIAALLEGATLSDLETIVSWPEDPSMTMTGAEALFRSVGHLREHVGHLHVMRDLWYAAHPA